MKTIVLDDEQLYEVIETEATKAGRTVQEIVVEALEGWLTDMELDEEEQVEIETARREWQEKGGVEAHEFFHKLREEGGRE